MGYLIRQAIIPELQRLATLLCGRCFFTVFEGNDDTPVTGKRDIDFADFDRLDPLLTQIPWL